MQQPGKIGLWILVLGGLFFSSAVLADELSTTLGQPVREVSHFVSIRVHQGVAIYTVQRTFANEGTLPEEAFLGIELPVGAVATGLRIRAKGVWYEGDLMAQDKAAQLYSELTGLGVYDPKDPAILYWASPGTLHLQIFPIFPGKTSVVEYTLTVPTKYQEGRYHISYPHIKREQNLANPILQVHSEYSDTQVFLDDQLVALNSPLVLPSPQGDDDSSVTQGVATGAVSIPAQTFMLADSQQTERSSTDTPLFLSDVAKESENEEKVFEEYTNISLTPLINTVDGRVGKVVASKQSSVFRLEIDAAPQLSQLPENLSVVFVLDASFSLGEEAIQAQIDLIKAFLSHVPDARFEVVLFRRFAEQLVGGFAKATEWEAVYQKAQSEGKFVLGNGSALEQGLQLAGSLLKGQKGPTMIVALTDGLLRARFKNQFALKALRTLPKNTVVHLAQRNLGSSSLSEGRDDKHPLAPIAIQFGGIFLSIDGPAKAKQKSLERVALGLVRPIQIDHFRAEAAFLEESHLDLPRILKEGDGLRQMHIVPKAPSRVVLHGMLWSKPWKKVIKVNKEFSKKTAAFVYSEYLYESLSEEEQKKVAYIGAAVSPHTSYLAIEPGVRPSTIGINRSSGLGFIGAGAGGGGLGYGSIGLGSVRISPDFMSLLEPLAQTCKKTYSALPNSSAQVEVETIYNEVADVILIQGNEKDPLNACLMEAIWSVRLTKEYNLPSEKFSLSW